MPEAPDAEAVAITHLRAHPDIAALAADDGGQPNVGSDVRGPYPMLRIYQSPVNGRAGAGGPQWLDAPELVVESWSAPPGAVPQTTKPALRELVYAALRVLGELPEREHDADDPVVTSVRVTFGPAWLPDPDAQQSRYAAGVMLYLHPPRS